MALDINFNTPANSNSGTSLDISQVRLEVIINDDEATVRITMKIFESPQAYLDDRFPVWVDEIPRSLEQFVAPISTNQYANIDMQNIHNQFRDILLHGATNQYYPPSADPNWNGLLSLDPLTTVVVNMP